MICLLLPPAGAAWLWSKCNRQKNTLAQWAASYGLWAAALYFACSLTLALLFRYTGNLVRLLGQDRLFAVKYMILALGFALAAPLALSFLQKKQIRFKKTRKTRGFAHWHGVLWAAAAVLFLLNFIRIFDGNFWSDEIFTILVAHKSPRGIISYTAGDVHPPLYYLIVWVLCQLFGYNAPVYRLASLVPYGILLVFALTAVYKTFGKEASALLIALASLVSSAVRYNLEARMYSLGALFVVLSFFWLHQVLTQNRKSDYVLFTLFSLCAAYTQYYALVGVAFFYLALLVYALLHRKAYLVPTLVSCGVTVAVYLPWLLVLLKTLARSTGDHWQTFVPGFQECVRYMFGQKLEAVLLVFVFWGFVGYTLLRRMNILQFAEKEGSWPVPSLSFRQVQCPAQAVWLLAGLGCTCGTALFGIGLSRLVRPFMLTRYMMLLAAVAWLMLAFAVAGAKHRKGWTALLLGVIFLVSLPGFAATLKTEQAENQALEATLAATQDKIGEGETLLNTVNLFQYGLLDYYYPGMEDVYVQPKTVPDLKAEESYWLITELSQDDEAVLAVIQAQGYRLESCVEEGMLGGSPVRIDKLVKN